MSRVITFATHFLNGHPKAGELTYFSEKIIAGIKENPVFLKCSHCGFMATLSYYNMFIYKGTYVQHTVCVKCNKESMIGVDDESIPFERYTKHIVKGHTIRAGHRFKAGDYFSPRIWSGKPYNSKQLILTKDIEIKKVFNIYLCIKDEVLIINGCSYVTDDSYNKTIKKLALNDGLSVEDFMSWFSKSFDGQIICWDDTINY